MNNENSEAEAKSKESTVVKEGNLSLEINTESDGRGGIRYYFNHPTKLNSKGTRAHKVQSPSIDIIKKLATEVLKEFAKDQVPLTRKEYEALQDKSKIMARLESQLAGTDLTLEMMIGQTVPTLKLLLPEGVTLAQALESGRAFHVPATPMTVDALIDGLIPLIAGNSTDRYCRGLLIQCGPLRERMRGQAIHRITPQGLEQLLSDVEEGLFLTEEEKETILIRNKWITPPVKRTERPKWYKDKTLVHYFNAWRRIFIRAKALGAWPLLRSLPTEVMEQPRAEVADLDAMSADDWEILVPALTKEMLRLVALVISDT